MALVNINRKNTDQFYRYKMPRLLAKVEGKGNGIKTVIVNMVDIGKSLQRPPAYPTKFFGCELGAQTQIDLKNERYIVNGAHDGDKLQEILDEFIQKFVLCPECDNPETLLHVETKKERIGQSCIACGYSGVISLTHRLITFILKNPPGSEDNGTPSKKDKKGRRDKKGQAQTQNGSTSPGHETAETTQDIPTMNVPSAQSDGFGDDDWSEDTSEAAVKKREMEGLSSRTKGMTINDDLELSQQDRLQMFYSFVEEKKRKNSVGKSVKGIVTEAGRLEVMDKAVLVLAELLFNEEMLAQIPKHSALFKKFLVNNQKAQKHLLGAFELLVGKSFPEKLMPKVPRLLQLLYQGDLIEEEVLLEWEAKVSKKYVSKEICMKIHEKAQPFITWLKEAEEESSDEDEGEEHVEVVYATEKEEKMKKEKEKEVENKEDDFDIDAI